MYIEESFAVEATKKNKKDPRWPVYIEWLKGLENKVSSCFGDFEERNPYYGVGYKVTNASKDYFKSVILTLDEVFSKYNIEMPESNLEKAKRLYPVGTRFKIREGGKIHKVYAYPQHTEKNTGSISVFVSEIFKGERKRVCVYNSVRDKWAEISPSEQNSTSMKRIQDLTKNDVVHCPTHEEAKAILKLAHEAGFKWLSGESFIKEDCWWIHKNETCYDLKSGEYCRIGYAKEENLTIHKASDFLPATSTSEPKPSQQKVEVGKWYKSIRGSDLFIRILSTDSGYVQGYGISSSGNWTELNSWSGLSLTVGVDLIEASEEEVFDRLKKFAISKGFVKGAVISAQSIHKVYYSHREIKSESFQLKNDYSLILGDCVDDEGRKEISSMILSKEGKWATVVHKPVNEEDSFRMFFEPESDTIYSFDGPRRVKIEDSEYTLVPYKGIDLKGYPYPTFGIDYTAPEQNNSEKNPELMKPLLLNPRNKKSKGVFLADTKDV